MGKFLEENSRFTNPEPIKNQVEVKVLLKKTFHQVPEDNPFYLRFDVPLCPYKDRPLFPHVKSL